MGWTRFDKSFDMWIVEDTITCDRWSFEGKADDVKAYIDEIVAKAEAMGMVGDGRFDFEVSRSYYGDGYDMTVKYEFTRTETDKETARREAAVEKEKARKAAERKKASEKRKLKKEAEYEEFLRLKAKFEGVEE